MTSVQEAILNDISSVQGELFMYLNKKGYDYTKFIPSYMNSNLCNLSMDADYCYIQLLSPEELIDFIKKETILKPDPFMKRPPDIVMYNIGYMYRYMSRRYRISSNELLRKIPLDDMEAIISDHIDDYEYSDYEAELYKMINK